MALKIEFASEFRDSERISRILNDLNSQFTKLAQSGAAIGTSASSGFQSLTSSLKGFDDATKGLKSIKDLSENIQSLSKLQGEIGTIDRIFSDLGRSISKGIGDEKANQIRNLKNEIQGLRSEAEFTGRKAQEAFAGAERAKARGEDPAKWENIAERFGVRAAEARKGARVGEETLEEAESPWNQLRDRFGRGSRFGRSVSRIGTGVGVGLAAIQGADELFNVAPMRARAVDIAYETMAAKEAMSGNITRQVMREMNIGTGASSRLGIGNDPLGQLGTVAGTSLSLILGNTLGNISNLISGRVPELKFPTQIYQEQLMAKEGVDKRVYDLTIGQAGEQALKRMNMFADIERFGGSNQMQAALTGLSGVGVSMDMAAPMAQMMYKAGGMLRGDYTDKILTLSQQRLGLGDTFMQQVARQRYMAGGGAAMGMVDVALGGTGLTGHEMGRARGVVGEALGAIMGQTVGYDLANTAPGLYTAVAGSVGARGPTLTPEEAARGGVQAYTAGMGMMAQGGVEDSIMMASLARMGITNPLDQQYIAALIRKGQPGLAADAIEKATGKKGTGLTGVATLKGDVGGMMGMFSGALLGTSKLKDETAALMAFGEKGVGDLAAQQALKTMGGIEGLARMPFETKMPTGSTAATVKLVQDMSDKERMQTGQAGVERSIYEAAQILEKELGRTIVDVIAGGFSDMATKIRGATKEMQRDIQTSKARTAEIEERRKMVEKAQKETKESGSWWAGRTQ